MTIITLNVVSIVIGVLIVRIIIVWFNSFKIYVESKVDYDIDVSQKDWEEFKREILGAIAVTAFGGFIIICILEWYRHSPDIVENNSSSKVENSITK